MFFYRTRRIFFSSSSAVVHFASHLSDTWAYVLLCNNIFVAAFVSHLFKLSVVGSNLFFFCCASTGGCTDHVYTRNQHYRFFDVLISIALSGVTASRAPQQSFRLCKCTAHGCDYFTVVPHYFSIFCSRLWHLLSYLSLYITVGCLLGSGLCLCIVLLLIE